ncbi:cytochrome P450 [Streptomyces flavofungini]|uniref:Cytochrome P450 n=1 Tax=Streptomyces flavofungini TaxID=68200 RepID=A0ABS0X3W6_9ACTN|nr:cytochrome P450 [Streptomyces flavofungini]MBJ3807885.1 cytochrome P450 [Streptomyces flavofungini]GHC78662.1 cytochrome P450 [Streptomyces flavofungini]
MTTPSRHSPHSASSTGTDPAAAPPPGCPAHQSSSLGRDGLRRLYGPEADQDLAGVYEKLRAEHGPVAPALIHNDVRLWAVLGHSENLHMIRTPSQYTRDSRQWTAVKDGTAGPDNPLAPVFTWQPMATFAEGAEHQRLRGAVTGAMAGLDHRGIRRHINRYSNKLLNDICETGRADLVSQFAEQLPMMVMLHVLGMPEDYSERMVQAARDMIKGTATAIESNAYVMEALTRHCVRRRAQPEEDFTSALIAQPAQLTDDEVAAHLRLVLIAAYEATANLIANVLRVVLTDPRFRAQLSGGQMTVPEAVEQSLWDEPPFSAMCGYFAKQDTQLGGQQIKQGDGLLFGIQPGNVDPVVRPDLSANMQGNRSHLAFGGGPHECPGQDIGRAIADTGVDALLMRLPDVELSVDERELSWRSSILSRHLVDLPVQFGKRPPQDVKARPMSHVPTPRKHWEVTSPAPLPLETPAAPPQPVVPAAPAAEPSAAPVRRKGAWRRLLEWWRGY